MIRELTCIICPLGCALTAELNGNEVVSVTGNTCPRGKKYAESECTNPMRTVTSTVRARNGMMIPVKTTKPIPKEKMFECMEIINSASPSLPIAAGDVIISDVFGADIAATADVSEN